MALDLNKESFVVDSNGNKLGNNGNNVPDCNSSFCSGDRNEQLLTCRYSFNSCWCHQFCACRMRLGRSLLTDIRYNNSQLNGFRLRSYRSRSNAASICNCCRNDYNAFRRYSDCLWLITIYFFDDHWCNIGWSYLFIGQESRSIII